MKAEALPPSGLSFWFLPSSQLSLFSFPGFLWVICHCELHLAMFFQLQYQHSFGKKGELQIKPVAVTKHLHTALDQSCIASAVLWLSFQKSQPVALVPCTYSPCFHLT